MAKTAKVDAERDERIAMEIVVDCYDEAEVAMGWHCYLQDALAFPFTATCRAKRAISPLRVGEEVEVIDMGPEDECAREMFVLARWNKGELAVPLSQLEVADSVDEGTGEAVGDWHYWVGQGREF